MRTTIKLALVTRILVILLVILIFNACQQNVKQRGPTDFDRAADAVKNADLEQLQSLLQQYPYLINARAPENRPEYRKGASLLHILSAPPGHIRNRTQIAEFLIRKGSDVNSRLQYSRGDTPLHWAARSDDIELIEVFLKHRADIESKGSVIESGSPLHVAIHFGSRNAAKYLAEKGADVHSAPLAAGLGKIELFRTLVSSESMQLPRYKITLMYLKSFNYAVFNQQFTLADQLLLTGVDINGRHGMDNYTLLHLVAMRGSAPMAKYLLKNGAGTHIQSGKDSLTPLQLAERFNNTRVANFLRNNE